MQIFSQSPFRRAVLALLTGLVVGSAGSVLSQETGLADTRWPRVVVSNPPLHSLMSGLLGDQAPPRLVFSRTVSHHQVALRPSQLEQLSKADLLVWSGPLIEQPIQTLIDKGVIEVRDWAAMECQGQRLLPEQPGLVIESTKVVVESPARDDHDLTQLDPHSWLDIDNGRCYIVELSRLLVEIDPGHREHYLSNAEALLNRLIQLDYQLQEIFTVVPQPFVVYHNSFRYLLDRYGWHAEGQLNPAHDQPPGLRQLLAFRQYLKTTRAVCLLADISASRSQLQEWSTGSEIRLVMLDPMGSGLVPGRELYFQLLTGLAQDIAACAGAE